MKKTTLIAILIMLLIGKLDFAMAGDRDAPPIYISFVWHMHQPVYVPYDETIDIISNNGPFGGPSFSFSLHEMWSSKGGPYRTWPMDAVEAGMNAGLPHLGAQVNLSGSLIESMNNLEYHNWNAGYYSNWKSRWQQGMSWTTSLGNPRIEVIGFPFHHPIGGLIDIQDLQLQIELHKKICTDSFQHDYSKGFFPAETCFHERMIPALKSAGLEWVVVDNIHLDRTVTDYPWTGNSGIIELNGADSSGLSLHQLDADSDWVQLNGVWAPENVSAWAHRPHYTVWTDPDTGVQQKIIAIPASCYLGNEDARGGFGALNYDSVMSQLAAYNTDAQHPLLIVLHHDGENYGSGSDSYYHSNFQNFVNWALTNSSRFVPTTIQDYLEQFPPDPSDIVHIEPGGWIGSGCLDPEFQYWLADANPFPSGSSPDWDSWSAITAAQNWVHTANQISPYSSIQNILTNSGNQTDQAWHDYLCAQASDYEYWEGGSDAVIWNSNAVRGCNLAVEHAEIVASSGSDQTGPSIFKPQRNPYNPGGNEWNTPQPSDFTVWSFIYDLSGITSAQVHYRLDTDGLVNANNMRYTGGQWTEVSMSAIHRQPESAIQPFYTADYYQAEITGLSNILVDYYIEAIDTQGNHAKSEICHVRIGTTTAGNDSVSWTPIAPSFDDAITITVHDPGQGGWLHWGVNAQGSDWEQPAQAYWPQNSTLFSGGPAVESQLIGPDLNGDYTIQLGPFNLPEQAVNTIDFVIHFSDDSWDNNDSADYHITLHEPSADTPTPSPTVTPSPTQPGNPTSTPTPWPTFTPPNTPSPTPSPPPGVTYTPVPTVTPVPDIQIQLKLNQPWFTNGDLFDLKLIISNPTSSDVLAAQYLILEVGGSFYFHPDWSSVPTATFLQISPSSQNTSDILTFNMPPDVPPSGPFFFYAGLMDKDQHELISNIHSTVFGFY